MTKRLFAVLRSRGAAWDEARPLEGQAGWPAHAEFMEALTAEGFVVVGGPLEETRDALLVIRASDAAEIVARLAADPWTRSGLLVVKQISPWKVRLGRLADA